MLHKMYVAAAVVKGETHNGCRTINVSNRFTSFDNKFTNLPGDVSLKAFWDSRRA